MKYTVFLVLIFVNFLLYGFGTAIQTLNKGMIEKSCEDGNKKAKRLNQMMEKPVTFVNTLQLVVTLINFIIGAFYVDVFAMVIRGWILDERPFLTTVSFILSMVLLLYIFLAIGVLAPKKIAAKYPEQWAYLLVNPMYYLTMFLIPLTFLVGMTSHILVRILGVDDKDSMEDVTEEEILSMVNEGHEQGVLEASEAEMITNIFEYGDKEAQDIMTHRENIIGIDSESTLEDALKIMLEGKNSRYPVYEENIDNIVGILHFKDVVSTHVYQKNRSKKLIEIEDLVKEAVFIPETRNINILFQSMQQKKIHMVIVVDEYGQTAGLVAMEDILEEIVGNILDEYDEEEEHINRQADNTYVMDGLTKLEEVEELLDISFEEEEVETLNGFLTNLLGRIPVEGDDFETEYEGYTFKIMEVENKVIKTVKCQKSRFN